AVVLQPHEGGRVDDVVVGERQVPAVEDRPCREEEEADDPRADEPQCGAGLASLARGGPTNPGAGGTPGRSGGTGARPRRAHLTRPRPRRPTPRRGRPAPPPALGPGRDQPLAGR